MTAGTEQPEKIYWGPWATSGIALVFLLIIFVSQGVVFLFQVVSKASANPTTSKFSQEEMQALIEAEISNGFALSVATCLSTAILLAAIWLAIRLRKGAPFRDYLALSFQLPAKPLLTYLGILLVFLAATDLTSLALGRDIVPTFMTESYHTRQNSELFWVAIVLLAPLGEECLIRGFLFQGFKHSSLGAIGTIILTSLLWAGLHVQYGFYEITQVFLLGIFLGYVRLKSNNLLNCIFLHMATNLGATIEAAIMAAE